MHKAVRRILAGNDLSGKAVVLSDAPASDVWLDPARPGFASTMVWVSDRTPAQVKGIREAPRFLQMLVPPKNGSICRYVEYPPEQSGAATRAQVETYFRAMGAPELAVSEGAHPYMQRSRSLDFCYILEGEIVLVLETGEVSLKAGDVIIQNAATHAWSNRSRDRCIVIMSQHGADLDAVPVAPSEFAKPDATQPRDGRRPIRRVVTGSNAQGRSCVLFDGALPNVFPRSSGSFFYEVWGMDRVPVPLRRATDGGSPQRPFSLSPSPLGVHWRISFLPQETADSAAPTIVKDKAEGSGTERREGDSHPGMHRTASLDYAICLEGERVLVLEGGHVILGKGDVVIQLGGWHTWARGANVPSIMSYVMIGGEFG